MKNFLKNYKKERKREAVFHGHPICETHTIMPFLKETRDTKCILIKIDNFMIFISQ